MALSRLSSNRFLVIATLWLLSQGNSHSAMAQVQWECMPVSINSETRTSFLDPADSTLYIGGPFWQVNGQPRQNLVAFKPDGTLVPIPNPLIMPTVITKWNGKITIGGFGGLAEYDGISWKKIDTAMQYTVFSLYPYQGKLLVGGQFIIPPGTSSAHERALMEYDGISLTSFKGLDSIIKVHAVSAIVEYNDDLIVAGNLIPYTPVNPQFKDIARWTGTSWQVLGPNGLPGGGLDGVNALQVIGNDLYVGGYFLKSNGSPGNHIARWNGSQWDDMGGGLPANLGAGVFGLLRQGDTLVVTGVMNSAGGKPAYHLARYWNGHWCNSTVNLSGGTNQSIEYFGDIVVTGGFDTVGTQICGRLAKVTSWGDCFAQAQAGIADRHSSTGDFQLAASPNPTEGRALVHYQVKSKGTARITVVDAVGKTLMAYEVPCSAGANEVAVDLKGLPIGIYTLQLSNAEGHGAIKIVKQ